MDKYHCVFIIYALVIILFAYDDFSVQIELYKFDIDKNGLFSAEETAAKGFDKASKNYTNDSPIIVRPFISGMSAAIVSFPILIIDLLIETLKKK